MNLRELLETAPAKAAGLFETLSDTSNGAVKSREKLFNALKDEFVAYGDLVEGHLLPALKQHEKTKGLVPDMLKAVKEFRGKHAEFDALPKDDEAFIPKLKELMKAFNDIVRNEQKELVPSVLRAVSEEQAAREQAEKEKAQARSEREQAAVRKASQKAADETARKASALKAAERARKAAEKKVAKQAAEKVAEKEAAEQSRKAAERKAVRAARKVAGQKAAEQVRKAAEQKAAERGRKAAGRKAAGKAAREAAESKATRAAQKAVERNAARAQQRAVEQTVAGPRSSDNGRHAVSNFHALAAFSMAATRGMTQMGSAWMEWLGGSSGAHAQQSLQLLRCRTMHDLAQTHQSYIAGSAQGWMEHNRRVLRISRAAAEESMRALGGSRPGPTAQ